MSVRAWATFICAAAISTPAIIAMPIPGIDVVAGREAGRVCSGLVAAVKLGVLTIGIMLTLNGLIGSYASRQFTRVVTPADWNMPAPRIQQLSTFALLTHPERHAAIVPGRYTRAGDIRRELVNRSVLSLMTAIFVWLRWPASGRPRRRRFWPLPASVMTVLVVAVFFATFRYGSIVEWTLEMQPGTGPLVPLLVFSAWALTEQRLSRRADAGGPTSAPTPASSSA